MGSEGLEPLMAGGVATRGGRSRKLRVHICSHKHKADRAIKVPRDTKLSKPSHSDILPPVLQTQGSARAAALQPQTAAVSRKHHVVSDPVSIAGTCTVLASKLVAVTGSGELSLRAEVQLLAWPGYLFTCVPGYPGPSPLLDVWPLLF